MIKRNISEEISSLFEYIRDVICTEHPNVIINEYTYILAVLHNEDSLAYQALSSIIMESTLEEMREFFETQITYAADTEDEAKFSEWVELLLDQALLAERGTLEDPNLFIRRMNQLLVS